MENMIEVAIDERVVKPHELVIVTEHRPDFLPPVTFAQADGHKSLLYACEGLMPIASYGEGTGIPPALGELFGALCGYISCLLAARDRLLDARLLSSDPLRGVFAAPAAMPASSVQARTYVPTTVKALWGADPLADEGEKICRIAEALATRERVTGAKTSMERMAQIIRSENPSLRDCLKTAENLCRSWNRIV